MSEPMQLDKILRNLLSVKCENCGLFPMVVGKKWCQRCINAYRQKQTLENAPEVVANVILQLVGELYAEAEIDWLDKGVKKQLQTLQAGQDVFIFGDVGVGKTYAMAAFIRKYICEGWTVDRINFDDFCVRVRSSMNLNSKLTEYGLVKSLKQVDKLFIDDLGIRSKQETDFAYVTLYSLLNKRQECRLPTFISTNKTIEQLGQSFDERIASRLKTALVIEMKGQDRRLSEKTQNQEKGGK